jgi:hypothetical protein
MKRGTWHLRAGAALAVGWATCIGSGDERCGTGADLDKGFCPCELPLQGRAR